MKTASTPWLPTNEVIEPVIDASSTRRVYGPLSADDERLVEVDRAEGVLREHLEDVAAAVDEPAVLEAAVPRDRAGARREVAAGEPADQHAPGCPDRRRHASREGELEAGD